MITVVLLVAAYIAGSIPFGLWLGKWFCGVDLREVGSGNIGATNAWRVLGWKVGGPVFVLDLAKGLLPVLAARILPIHGSIHTDFSLNAGSQALAVNNRVWFEDWQVVGCGIAAILGHNFSPFLRFKGGKGVATSLGVCIGMSWKAGLAGFATWAVVLALVRFISVASLIGTPVGALCIWLDNDLSLPYGIFAILATLFVFIKHRSNIKRLIDHTEPRFGEKKPPDSTPTHGRSESTH